MIIYHGTSERHLESILKFGLLSHVAHNNWEYSNDYENPKGFVYLGWAPIQYSANACYDGSRGLILEIELQSDSNLYPDAHCIAFKNGPPAKIPDKEDIKQEVLKSKHLTSESMKKYWSTCHWGSIHKDAIKRYALIDWTARKSMNDLWLQESSMRSYGGVMAQYVFNEDLWVKMPKGFYRTGIEIVDVISEASRGIQKAN